MVAPDFREGFVTKTTDINLTAIMEREGIASIRRTIIGARFCVALDDGRVGVGATVGEALAAAQVSDDLATFARKAAA